MVLFLSISILSIIKKKIKDKMKEREEKCKANKSKQIEWIVFFFSNLNWIELNWTGESKVK